MHITGLYAALAALLVVALSIRVVLRRISARISLGDGDDKELKKRIRAQANCIEYLPLALLLLLMLELNQTQPMLVHACGITLIAARVVHGFGLSRTGGLSPGAWSNSGCLVADGCDGAVDLAVCVAVDKLKG
jgi:uncharacterized membrane protein YecN with MAPEG domain